MPDQPNPNQKRGPWSSNEDAYLISLVQLHGAFHWVRIAHYLTTRTPKQCRERYHQNLKPGLNHAPITPEEGRKIERLVLQIGKRWAEIARRLDGRSDNAVKNWWNGAQNRRKRLHRRRVASATTTNNGNNSANRTTTASTNDNGHHNVITAAAPDAADPSTPAAPSSRDPRSPYDYASYDHSSHDHDPRSDSRRSYPHRSHSHSPHAYSPYGHSSHSSASSAATARPSLPPTGPRHGPFGFPYHAADGRRRSAVWGPDVPLLSPSSTESPREYEFGSNYTTSPANTLGLIHSHLERPPARTGLDRIYSQSRPTRLPSLTALASESCANEPWLLESRQPVVPEAQRTQLPTAPSSPIHPSGLRSGRPFTAPDRDQRSAERGDKDSIMDVRKLLD